VGQLLDGLHHNAIVQGAPTDPKAKD
jgi:hypothetical protein